MKTLVLANLFLTYMCVVWTPVSSQSSYTCDPTAWYSDFSCSADTRSGARCSGDGFCRCPNIPHVDECTCLVNYGSCRVETSSSAGNAAAVPSYRGSVQSTRSCTANDNCNSSVHVISVYEARSDHSFRYHPTGSASVRVTVSGGQSDTRPLILVLASHEPITWSISMPQGVTFEKILVGSYYIDQTTVIGVSSSTFVERLSSCSTTIQCYADGYDDDTVEQLQYITDHYGPVSSWSNAYRANNWNLRIQRNGCTSEPNTPDDQSCPFVSITTTPSTSTRPSIRPPVINNNRNQFSTHSNSVSVTVVSSVVSTAVFLIIVIILGIVVFAVLKSYQRRRTIRQPASITSRQTRLTAVSIDQPSQRAHLHSLSPQTRVWTQPSASASTNPEQMGTPSASFVSSAPPSYHDALSFPPPKDDQKPPPYM